MLEQIKKIIVDELGTDPSTITEETRFTEDLHADSLDMVQMIIDAEMTFGVHFDDEDIVQIKTVGDVLNFLKGR